MDKALIQNTKDDVDRHERSNNKQWFIGQCLLKGSRGSGKCPMDGDRYMEFSHCALNGCNSRGERLTLGEVEGKGRCDKRALMIDRQRRGARCIVAEGGKRHHALYTGAD